MSDREHAKRLGAEYFQAFVKGDTAWWREDVSPDFRRHDPALLHEVV